jgi:hypothetical protein
MARTDIVTLKSKFETGDRPTGQDYVDLIDTLISQATDLGTAGNNEHVINGIENQTVIDSFVASEWRMVKYIISITKTSGGSNKFYATELSVLIDGANLNVSQYGVIDNDGEVGTISMIKDGIYARLIVTPISGITPVTVRFGRMGLKA